MTRREAPPPDDRRARLREAFRFAELTPEGLWTRYFALGGDGDLLDVEAHLEGLVELAPFQGDLLALAVNERLDELTAARRVPLVQLLQDVRPPSSPLRSLAEMLEAAHRAPPERLGAIARAAGRALGVDVTVHLSDHEQLHLVALPADPGPRRARLRIEGTLAGRAYQNLEVLPSVADGIPRLWVPLEDGTERLGVLEVRTGTAEAMRDPGLRDHSRWLALLIGHLVASIGRYGDELERVRRSRPPTPAAELIWRQLPPLTAATDAFVLAGSLEPTYDVGGDAFDFALTEETVSLAVFDAMGHGMPAALLASAALAAYRSTRRDQRGIYEQARSLDETIARCFPGSAFVTGVLAELDVASGRLRYVAAGHPPPLLLRGRKVVKALDGGRRGAVRSRRRGVRRGRGGAAAGRLAGPLHRRHHRGAGRLRHVVRRGAARRAAHPGHRRRTPAAGDGAPAHAGGARAPGRAPPGRRHGRARVLACAGAPARAVIPGTSGPSATPVTHACNARAAPWAHADHGTRGDTCATAWSRTHRQRSSRPRRCPSPATPSR